MFEIPVGEVAGADVAALAAALFGLSEGELLGSDVEAAQAVVAAAQRVINAVSAVQLLGIEAWSRRAGEEIAADRARWQAVNPGRGYPGPRGRARVHGRRPRPGPARRAADRAADL